MDDVLATWILQMLKKEDQRMEWSLLVSDWTYDYSDRVKVPAEWYERWLLCDKLLIFVNLDRNHWVLGAFDQTKRVICIYDSAAQSSNRREVERSFKFVANAILKIDSEVKIVHCNIVGRRSLQEFFI
jgi:hypothetical protein